MDTWCCSFIFSWHTPREPLPSLDAAHLSHSSLPQPTLFDQSLDRDFAQCPALLEDGLRDGGARYTGAAPGGVHVVVDRHLVTGQNEASTLTAVQNLVLICNQLK